MAKRVIKQTLLGERVYRGLRADLLSGSIRPGARVTEEWAANHYSGSRTPVREACRRLAEEGLLVHEPRRGYRAAPISAQEIDELYEVRRVLEMLAVRRAARYPDDQRGQLDQLRADWTGVPLDPGQQVVYKDEEFHRVLAGVGGNSQLVAMLDAIAARIRVVRVHDFLDRDRIASTHVQHSAILDAVCRRDGDLAAALMHAHISESQRAVVEAAANAAAATGTSAG